MGVYPYQGIWPMIDAAAFVAPSADVIGDVRIGARSGVWFQCVVRGDVNPIRIGEETNIQDGTIVHVTRVTSPTTIGSRVTVGHQCILHGCTIGDEAFIGMGSVVMDDAAVEAQGFLAAGSLLTQGKRIKSRELWAGRPAKFVRMLTQEELDFLPVSAKNYALHAEEYREIMQNKA